MDTGNKNMDSSPDSSFFSESEFVSGSFKSNNDSHGFNLDSVLGSSNNAGCFSFEPSFDLDVEVIEFQFPFSSDSDAVLVPEIF